MNSRQISEMPASEDAKAVLARQYDVLVAGGGNAALCAAIAARRAGASVLVVEGAPKFYRGGNTRHTRNYALRP